MSRLSRLLRALTMKQLIFIILVLSTSIVDSAVWRDPSTGIWVGNICQTRVGWQQVVPQPIGSVCYAQAFGQYGFIASY